MQPLVAIRMALGSWPYLGANNDDLPTNDNGSRLFRLSHECKIFIMNSIYHSKQHHRYSPTGFTKRVDYTLTEWHIKSLARIVVIIVEPAFHFRIPFHFGPHMFFPIQMQEKNFFSQTYKHEENIYE